jgi:hypothetical protein
LSKKGKKEKPGQACTHFVLLHPASLFGPMPWQHNRFPVNFNAEELRKTADYVVSVATAAVSGTNEMPSAPRAPQPSPVPRPLNAPQSQGWIDWQSALFLMLALMLTFIMVRPWLRALGRRVRGLPAKRS